MTLMLRVLFRSWNSSQSSLDYRKPAANEVVCELVLESSEWHLKVYPRVPFFDTKLRQSFATS